MYRKRICFIAQFPPPMHGLSKAVETLYNSNLQKEFELEKVDITDNKKFIKNLIKISNSKAELFYFTISQTKYGNIRDLIILQLLSIQGKKCIVHLHGGYYGKLVDNNMSAIQRKWNYKAMSNIKSAIVLSNSLKNNFINMLNKERIIVVPNCVDNEFLMSEDEFALKVKSLKTKKVLHILYLSNFIKSKGYMDVLEIAKLERKRVEEGGIQQFHFDFAGKFFEKRDEESFNKFIKDNDLNAYITFHGIVSGEVKKRLLMKSDIFVLLSRYPKEGQPISILEAMGNGMMIVTTNVGGIPDLVDNKSGVIVDYKHINPKNIFDQLILKLNRIDEIWEYNRIQVLSYYRESLYIANMRDVFYRSI